LESTILIVDDQPTIRASLALMFTRAGYRTLTAADGVAAEAVLRDWRADLVLLDLGLPERDGVETLPALRRVQPGLPAIIITGWPDAEAAAAAAGADALLEKPLEIPQILEVVRQLLATRQSIRV
jgi:two-component system KDP operon response regulator KdpE